VAEQQDWLAIGGTSVGGSGEIDLQAVAEVVAGVESGAAAEGFELGCEEGGDVVDGWLVVAGGLDLDELADCVHYFVLALGKIVEAIGPRGLRVCYCRFSRFSAGHISLALEFTARPGVLNSSTTKDTKVHEAQYHSIPSRVFVPFVVKSGRYWARREGNGVQYNLQAD
jgi:hypothetical protein